MLFSVNKQIPNKARHKARVIKSSNLFNFSSLVNLKATSNDKNYLCCYNLKFKNNNIIVAIVYVKIASYFISSTNKKNYVYLFYLLDKEKK